MLPAPPTFSGTFSEFFQTHVAPNTPCPDRVHEFDHRLRQYLASTDPIHVVRKAGTQDRGTICTSDTGSRMLPTDNSPVWWIHAFLLSNAPFPSDNKTLFERLPYHMFKLPSSLTYLNSAGFHAAHIVNAKDGNTNWDSWSREELWRRTVVNIHPCNMFLVAKIDWRVWGGKPDIIECAKHLYRERYGALMTTFLREVGESNEGGPLADVPYHYAAEPKNPKKPRFSTPTQVTVLPDKLNATAALMLNRPMIKSALIATETDLEITTIGKRFLVPHDALLDWVGKNTNALQTDSWIKKGLYSWPRPSQKMIVFLHQFEMEP